MNKIEFIEKYDALLCLNSDLPEREFFKQFKIPIIASDGAGILLYRMGILPDKVIGDLDSFYYAPESEKFNKERIVHIEEQDTNDFEKCLKYCINYNFKNILITGFHGGQLEHTLNNWSVFKRYSYILNLCIYDKGRYGFSPKNDFEIQLKKDEIISLIPQPKIKLKTEGLFWELNDEIVELGKREGGRNQAKNKNIKIKIIDGDLIVFIDDRLPFAPNL